MIASSNNLSFYYDTFNQETLKFSCFNYQYHVFHADENLL